MDKPSGWLSLHDPNSFSNPEAIHVENMNLNWDVDFSRKIISGKVTYDLVILNTQTNTLILDTKNLKIKEVKKDEKKLEWTLGDAVLTFGQPLSINISRLDPTAGKVSVEVEYETTEECSALQWLDKEQTAGKAHPYVFSQCQPIHARSLLPCQDTPFNKATYQAEVRVPTELQPLMSAVSEESKENGDKKTYNFIQKVPIPSYLIALAVGNLKGKKVGPRTTVWTEPELLDASAYEFQDTEDFLKKAELVAGEYVWGTYDILVLPPSFPFGGMENPCLTFATPTLLAGDHSLVNTIYHEIAHSWTGNLVTNKNFEHFWLNEGFTVFLERKILAAIKGEDQRQLASIEGLKVLKDAIKTQTPELTKLVVNLTNIDPDDAFSVVPYEKGYTFLYFLEEIVGQEQFSEFLKKYIHSNRFKSIDTDYFKKEFTTYFKDNADLSKIDWDAWLYTNGMPIYEPKYDTKLSVESEKLKTRWVEWNNGDNPFNKSDIDTLISAQIVQFLTLLLEEDNFPLDKLKAMEQVYNFNSIKNSEIRFRWLRLSLRSRWESQVDSALNFVTEQGRMKFVRPIYRELYNWEQVREKTIQHFKKTRSGMMHVCQQLVAKDLGILE